MSPVLMSRLGWGLSLLFGLFMLGASVAPKLLGPDARPLVHLPPLGRLADAAAWRIHDLRQIGPDIRIMLRSNR